MGDKGEDIFTENFGSKTKDDNEKKSDVGDSNPKDDKSWEITDRSDKEKPKKSRKKGIVFAIIIGIIVASIVFAGEVLTDTEPFDPAECNFGVVSDLLFFERCATLEEFEANEEAKKRILEREQQRELNNTAIPTNEPFKDVSSTSDKVEVEKTNELIGFFSVTTEGDWYGDFVDFRKIPNKIEKTGSMRVNFRCYTDDFQGTSTYFGTFRNLIENNLTIEVYINGMEVESQTTTTNKALILEGSCYGHES